jgi:hypothetical protein
VNDAASIDEVVSSRVIDAFIAAASHIPVRLDIPALTGIEWPVADQRQKLKNAASLDSLLFSNSTIQNIVEPMEKYNIKIFSTAHVAFVSEMEVKIMPIY